MPECPGGCQTAVAGHAGGPLDDFELRGAHGAEIARAGQRHNAPEAQMVRRGGLKASLIRTLFHNQPGALSVTGGKAIISRVTGPVESPTSEPSVIGRRVNPSAGVASDMKVPVSVPEAQFHQMAAAWGREVEEAGEGE